MPLLMITELTGISLQDAVNREGVPLTSTSARQVLRVPEDAEFSVIRKQHHALSLLLVTPHAPCVSCKHVPLSDVTIFLFFPLPSAFAIELSDGGRRSAPRALLVAVHTRSAETELQRVADKRYIPSRKGVNQIYQLDTLVADSGERNNPLELLPKHPDKNVESSELQLAAETAFKLSQQALSVLEELHGASVHKRAYVDAFGEGGYDSGDGTSGT
eukprot:gene2257-2975_t